MRTSAWAVVMATLAGCADPECAEQHGGDAAEPDECAALAKELPLGKDVPRTLSTAGDRDWAWFPARPGVAFEVTVTSSGAPLIEVFAPGEATPQLTGGNGTSQVKVTHLATSSRALVRVRDLHADARDLGYTVRVDELGTDDLPNLPGEAPFVELGGQVEGRVQYPGDRDVVKVTVPAHQRVRFTNDAASGAFVEVRTEGGARRLDPGRSSVVAWPDERVVALTASPRPGSPSGTFAFTTEVLGEDDWCDDPLLADLAPPPLDGELSAADVDSVQLDVTPGLIYRLDLTVPPEAAVALEVLDASGAPLSTAQPAWFVSRTPRIFVSIVRRTQDPPIHRWHLELTEIGADDYGDTVAAATELVEGVTRGRIEQPADQDWFTFIPEPGKIYEASAIGGVSLLLTDAANHVTGSRFAATSASPWYHLRVARGGAAAGATYTLTIAQVGLDDCGDTPATATHVPNGTVFRGVNEWSGDTDALTFDARANFIHRLECRAGTSACRVVTVDPLGVRTSIGSPHLFVSPGGAGVALVKGAGSYEFSVTEVGPEDHGALPATATPMTVGAPVTGTIGFPSDVDLFEVHLTARRSYTLVVTGEVAATVLDAQLRPAWLETLAAPYTGSYFLEVKAGNRAPADYSIVVQEL